MSVTRHGQRASWGCVLGWSSFLLLLLLLSLYLCLYLGLLRRSWSNSCSRILCLGRSLIGACRIHGYSDRFLHAETGSKEWDSPIRGLRIKVESVRLLVKNVAIS
jgi:hypothetical protein